jgi:pimeloyl-ACP methyl ester carboxylesterase
MLMEPARTPYRSWRANTIRGKKVWTRFKQGSDKLPTLALFTGLGINGTRLNKAIDLLEERYGGNVIGVELPGQGRSERFRIRCRASHFALEIEDVLAATVPGFDPKETVLIGHCHSPLFINAYAQSRGVAGTVLLNPFPLDSTFHMVLSCLNLGKVFLRQSRDKLGKDREKARADGAAAVLRDRLKKAVNFLEAGLVWRTSRYETQVDSSPLLIAISEHDDVISPAYARGLSRRITNCRLTVMEGSTHFSTFREPGRAVELILDFAKKIQL